MGCGCSSTVTDARCSWTSTSASTTTGVGPALRNGSTGRGTPRSTTRSRSCASRASTRRSERCWRPTRGDGGGCARAGALPGGRPGDVGGAARAAAAGRAGRASRLASVGPRRAWRGRCTWCRTRPGRARPGACCASAGPWPDGCRRSEGRESVRRRGGPRWHAWAAEVGASWRDERHGALAAGVAPGAAALAGRGRGAGVNEFEGVPGSGANRRWAANGHPGAVAAAAAGPRRGTAAAALWRKRVERLIDASGTGSTPCWRRVPVGPTPGRAPRRAGGPRARARGGGTEPRRHRAVRGRRRDRPQPSARSGGAGAIRWALQWVRARARASLTWCEGGRAGEPEQARTMYATCALSARPVPTSACFTWSGP
jgi:hypothetical protein